MPIIISKSHFDKILGHCANSYPAEAGGFLGGKGDISVTANVVPAAIARMCELALAGKAEEARAINQRLLPLHEAMFVESNPIPVKWGVIFKTGNVEAGANTGRTLYESMWSRFLAGKHPVSIDTHAKA